MRITSRDGSLIVERRNGSAPQPELPSRPSAPQTERKAVTDAQKIVAIWNARPSRWSRVVVLPDDRRRHRGGCALAHLLMPSVPASRLHRPAHPRPASGRFNFQHHPVGVVPAVLA